MTNVLNAMTDFDVTALCGEIAALVANHGLAPMDRAALSEKLCDLLFSSRGLWHAFKSQLVTLDEASEAVTAHLETWFEATGAVSAYELGRHRSELVALLRATFERES